MSRWKKPKQPKELEPGYRDLFSPGDEHGLCRKTDPETSFEASRSVNLTKSKTLFLETVRPSPNGLTFDEICDRTGKTKVSISSIAARLVEDGLLFSDGEKRMGKAGRYTLVWKVVGVHERMETVEV